VRFSLAAILTLGLTALALAQPTKITPTEDEKKAMALVVQSGGKAELDPRLAPEARVSAKFESATDGVLAALKKAPQIGALDAFDATRCTDKGFAVLKDLPNLRKLTLGKSEMSTGRVAAIAQCKELRVLYLAGSGLTDVELVTLKKLTRLESLDISDNPYVTDKGMASIAALDRLQMLYLGKTGLTDKGLQELKVLDGLRSLNVVGTKVTGEAAEAFADEMPNLRAVRR
jgi:Leucine-rich repeat (LRR) protein